MKIMKYILKPIKYLALLTMFCALIYFRSIIFQQDINKNIDKALSYIENEFNIEIPEHIVEIKPEVITRVVSQQESTEFTTSEINIESKEDNNLVATSDKNDASTDNPVIINNGLTVDNEIKDKQSAIIEELTETVDLINQKVDKLLDVSNTITITQKELAKKEPTVDKTSSSPSLITEKHDNIKIVNPTATPINDDSSSDTKQMLIMARQSFWNGNTQLSEKVYLDLTSHEETDPDIYGELGNVYYAQGKWKQAGEAYYEAAIRLLDLKQNDQVNYLLRVIQGLDTASAEKLKQKISG